MHWKAEGVSRKKTELEQHLHKNSISICWIQETYLQKGNPFQIRGYQAFQSDKDRRKVEWWNNLNVHENNRNMNDAEYIKVKVMMQDSIITVNYYCLSDKLLPLDIIQVRESDFLVTGDLNSQS